jgi:hypothetical protein
MALALEDEVRLAGDTVITYCANLTITVFNVTYVYNGTTMLHFDVLKCYINIIKMLHFMNI